MRDFTFCDEKQRKLFDHGQLILNEEFSTLS